MQRKKKGPAGDGPEGGSALDESAPLKPQTHPQDQAARAAALTVDALADLLEVEADRAASVALNALCALARSIPRDRWNEIVHSIVRGLDHVHGAAEALRSDPWWRETSQQRNGGQP